jgi:hypothetical protein
LDYINNNPCSSAETLALLPTDYYHRSASFYDTGIKNFKFIQGYRCLREDDWSGW